VLPLTVGIRDSAAWGGAAAHSAETACGQLGQPHDLGAMCTDALASTPRPRYSKHLCAAVSVRVRVLANAHIAALHGRLRRAGICPTQEGERPAFDTSMHRACVRHIDASGLRATHRCIGLVCDTSVHRACVRHIDASGLRATHRCIGLVCDTSVHRACAPVQRLVVREHGQVAVQRRARLRGERRRHQLRGEQQRQQPAVAVRPVLAREREREGMRAPGGLTREVESPVPSNNPHDHMILRVELKALVQQEGVQL
jgi:hypothetical protein